MSFIYSPYLCLLIVTAGIIVSSLGAPAVEIYRAQVALALSTRTYTLRAVGALKIHTREVTID